MTPIPPPGANLKFVGDGCGDLPARLETDEPIITTHWKLTEEQAANIIAGGRTVQLEIFGSAMPPVRMSVINIWDDKTPIYAPQ